MGIEYFGDWERDMKTVVKIVTVLLGLTMLLGGGICVATDTMIIVMNGTRNFQGILFMLPILAVAAAITWGGWALLKSVKTDVSSQSIDQASGTTDEYPDDK